MKRVVHVVEAFASGVYTFLTELCNSTSSKYEIIIIYSVRKETPENFRKDFNDEIKFIQVDMCRDLEPVKNINSLIHLYKILKKLKPDVVHLHSSKAGFLGRMACFIMRFNMDNVFYNPHGYSFFQENQGRLKRRLFYTLECFAAALGGCTAACSKGEYIQGLKISKRCININNGIDSKEIDKITAEMHRSPGRIKIGTIGRICFQKNPLLFNKIAESHMEYDFMWIGDGELRQALCSKNIKVTGWLEREQALRELSGIDVFILTSLWEGLPVSLLEAMYLEKTVVVSNIAGCRDVVQHKINGFIAKDFNEYIETINYITISGIYDDEKFKSNVKNCILEQYEKRKMVEGYVSLYENKLNS